MMTKQDLGSACRFPFGQTDDLKCPINSGKFLYVEALCHPITVVGHGNKWLIF